MDVVGLPRCGEQGLECRHQPEQPLAQVAGQVVGHHEDADFLVAVAQRDNTAPLVDGVVAVQFHPRESQIQPESKLTRCDISGRPQIACAQHQASQFGRQLCLLAPIGGGRVDRRDTGPEVCQQCDPHQCGVEDADRCPRLDLLEQNDQHRFDD